MTSSTPRSGGLKHLNWTLVAAFAVVALIGGVVGGLVGYALHPGSASAARHGICELVVMLDTQGRRPGPPIGGHDQRQEG